MNKLNHSYFYERYFCWRCKYFDGYDLCTKLGTVTYDIINICKEHKLFKEQK